MSIPYIDNYFGLMDALQDEIKYGINIEFDRNEKHRKQLNYAQKIIDKYDRMDTLPESDIIKHNLLSKVKAFGDQSYRSQVNQIGNDSYNEVKTAIQLLESLQSDAIPKSSEQGELLTDYPLPRSKSQGRWPRTIYHEQLEKMIERDFPPEIKAKNKNLLQKLKEIVAAQRYPDFHVDPAQSQYLEALREKLLVEQRRLQEEHEQLQKQEEAARASQNIQKNQENALNRFADDIAQLQEMISLTLMKNQQLKAQLDYLTFSHDYSGTHNIQNEIEAQREEIARLAQVDQKQALELLKQQKEAVTKENIDLTKQIKQKKLEKQRQASFSGAATDLLKNKTGEILLDENTYEGVAYELGEAKAAHTAVYSEKTAEKSNLTAQIAHKYAQAIASGGASEELERAPSLADAPAGLSSPLKRQLKLVDLHLAELRDSPLQQFYHLHSNLQIISGVKSDLMKELELFRRRESEATEHASSIFTEDTKRSFEENQLDHIHNEIEVEKVVQIKNENQKRFEQKAEMHFSATERAFGSGEGMEREVKEQENHDLEVKDVQKETEMVKSFLQEGKKLDEQLEKSRAEFLAKSGIKAEVLKEESHEAVQVVQNARETVKEVQKVAPVAQKAAQEPQEPSESSSDSDSDDMTFNVTVKRTYGAQIDEKQRKNQELLKKAQANARAK